MQTIAGVLEGELNANAAYGRRLRAGCGSAWNVRPHREGIRAPNAQRCTHVGAVSPTSQRSMIGLGIAATPTAAEENAVRDRDGDTFSADVPIPEF